MGEANRSRVYLAIVSCWEEGDGRTLLIRDSRRSGCAWHMAPLSSSVSLRSHGVLDRESLTQKGMVTVEAFSKESSTAPLGNWRGVLMVKAGMGSGEMRVDGS